MSRKKKTKLRQKIKRQKQLVTLKALMPLLFVAIISCALLWSSNTDVTVKAAVGYTDHGHNFTAPSKCGSAGCNGTGYSTKKAYAGLNGNTKCSMCSGNKTSACTAGCTSGKVKCTTCSGLGYTSKTTVASGKVTVNGTQKSYGCYVTKTACTACGGSGFTRTYYAASSPSGASLYTDGSCTNGTGKVNCSTCEGDGLVPCAQCKGSGYYGVCGRCNGQKKNYRCQNSNCAPGYTGYDHWESEPNYNSVCYTTENHYNIVFNGNGADGGSTGAINNIAYTQAVNLTANGFYKNGHSFAGWNTDPNGNGTACSDGQLVSHFTATDAATVTLYAQWTKNSYNVYFDAAGGQGAPGTQSFVFNSQATISTTKPTRTGYTFVRWKASHADYYMNPGAAIPEGWGTFTLVAQWTPNQYTISFNLNGGESVYTNSVAVTYDSSSNCYLDYNIPTRTGYIFSGWYTASSGGTQVYGSDGRTVSDGTYWKSTANGIVWSYAGNPTLYAQWTPASYLVSFDANEGTCGTANKYVTYASTYGDLPTPTRTGYRFKGWFTAYAGGTQITSSSAMTTASAHTLYAQWEKENYTVIFDAMGGTCGTSSKTVTYNQTYGTLPTPSRTGYIFDGWYTAASGGSAVASSTVVSQASSHSLYAHWTPIGYTIIFDKNGGEGSMGSLSVLYDKTVTLTANGFTRLGYDCIGWSTSPTATSPMYTDMQQVSNLSSVNGSIVTLYAVWERKGFTVTYNGNGGTVSVSAQTVLFEGLVDLSVTASKDGHTFVGWALDENSRTTLTEHRMPAENIILYAVYSIEVSDLGNHDYPEYTPNGENPEVFLIIWETGNKENYRKYPLEYQYDIATMTYRYKLRSTDVSTFANTVAQYEWVVYALDNAGNSKILASGSQGPVDPPELPKYYVQKIEHYYFGQTEPFEVYPESVEEGKTFNPALYVKTITGFTASGNVEEYVVDGERVTKIIYTPNNYTVFFDANGGLCDIDSKTVTYKEAYGDLPIPRRTGYSFGGWVNDEGTIITNSTIYTILGNSTVTAKWIPNVYEIILNNQGAKTSGTAAFYEKYAVGNYSSASCTNDIFDITKPEKEGYIFKGYFTKPNGAGECYVNENGVITSSATTFTSNTTLFAHWEPIKYVIHYDGDGASGSMADTEAVYDQEVVLRPNEFVKEGHSFKGWTTSKGGEVVYENAQTVKNLRATEGDVITLYPVWEVNKYVVTYDYWTNGGTDVTIAVKETPYGSEIDLSVIATKPGYEFVGWNTDPNATEGLTSLNMPAQNITLYAIYKKTVTFSFVDILGAQSSISKTIYNNTAVATITLPNIREDNNWQAQGWSLSTQVEDGINNPAGGQFSSANNVSFYAMYEKEITASFVTNHPEVVMSDIVDTVLYNASGDFKSLDVTLVALPEQNYYSFSHWAYNTQKYAVGDKLILLDDAVIEAIWDKFPAIYAEDRYFTLTDAKNGVITLAELLNDKYVYATDREDDAAGTKVTITVENYLASEYTSLTNSAEFAVTFVATDSFGNITKKTITVFVVNSELVAQKQDYGIRFIDKKYFNTDTDGVYVSETEGGLRDGSIWKLDSEYANLLTNALSINKTGQIYKDVTIGSNTQSVLVPSSGQWQTTYVTHSKTRAEIEAVKEYIKANGFGKYKNPNALEYYIENYMK